MNKVLLVIMLMFIAIRAVSLEPNESECKAINNNSCTYKTLECGCPSDRPVTLIDFHTKESSLIAHEGFLNSADNCLVTKEGKFEATFSKTTREDCGDEGCTFLYEVKPKPQTSSSRSVLFKGNCVSRITPVKFKNKSADLETKVLELIDIDSLKSRLIEKMKDTYTRLQFHMESRSSNASAKTEAHIAFSDFSKIKLDSESLHRELFFMTGKKTLGDNLSIETYDFKNNEFLHVVEVNLYDELPRFDKFESKVATYLFYQKAEGEVYPLLNNENFTRWFFKRHKNEDETDITSRNSKWPILPFGYNGEVYFISYSLGLGWNSNRLYKVVGNEAVSVSYN
jgi:hypothetical protein